MDLVDFSENTVGFVFGDIIVTIMGSFAYRLGTDAEPIHQIVPVGTSSVMTLVGRLVERCHVDAVGSLIVELSGTSSIAFLDDSQSYESYLLKIGSTEIVV